MADTSPERTYKYQVPADVFVEAITTFSWNSQQIQKFNKLGIDRLNGNEIDDPNNEFSFRPNYTYTIFKNVSVIEQDYSGWITIKNQLPRNLHHLVLIDCKINHIAFHNCGQIIKEEVVLPKFYFINCEILTLSFEKSEFSFIGVYNNHKPTHIQYVNCKIGKIVFENSFLGEIRLSKNTVTGDITVNKCGSTNSLLIIDSSAEDLIIKKSTCKSLSFNNGKTNTISISNSIIGGIIARFTTTGNITIWSKSYLGYLRIESSNLGYVIVSKISAGKIEILDTTTPHLSILGVRTFLELNRVNIVECRINKCMINLIKIKNQCKIELYILKSTINNIEFDTLILGKESNISVIESEMYFNNFDRFSVLGNIYLKKLKKIDFPFPFNVCSDLFEVETWEVNLEESKQNYQGHKHASFTLVEKQGISKPTFRISQSSLGKTEFTECDLAGFNFEFNNSKITEVFISGGTVPDDVVVYDEINPVKTLEQQKSFFDQLKKVFENQGDIVRGTKYHAKASAIQMKILWSQKNIAELLVYVFNWLSNKHGESWLRGFCFIVVIAGLFFWGYNWALVPDKYDFVGWNNIFQWESWRFLADYVKFIDVTHKFNFMVENPNPRAIVVDFVARIFIVYGIYQMVAAFRKHGKRG